MIDSFVLFEAGRTLFLTTGGRAYTVAVTLQSTAAEVG